MPPPNSPPAPPLASLTEITPISAQLGQPYPGEMGSRYPASHAIDGDLQSKVLSVSALSSDQWLSVRLPLGSRVDYVAIYNRNDNNLYHSWLSPFELWLGDGPGNTRV